MRRTRTGGLPARFLLLGFLALACASAGNATPSSSSAGGRWLIVTDDASTDPIRLTALQAAKDVGRSIAERLHLPRDITIRLDSCGDGAPQPAGDGSELLLCDEAVREVANALKRVPVVNELANADDAGDALLSVTRFLLAQQLGYALVDQLLPQAPQPSVREADEFAALFLLGDPRLSHDVSSAAQVLPFIHALPDGAVAAHVDSTTVRVDSTAPGTAVARVNSMTPGAAVAGIDSTTHGAAVAAATNVATVTMRAENAAPTNVATVTMRAENAARVEALLCLSEGATANTSSVCRERLTAKLALWESRLRTIRLR
ncbi:MAG: hypothetical protein ACREKM_09500 [Longimicrobiales bacterium]